MRNGQNIVKNSFILDKELKDVHSLVKKLKSSLNTQKECIKEIESKFQNLVNNNSSYSSSMNDLFVLLPNIIKQVGIPFAHSFLYSEKIKLCLIELYFDTTEKYQKDVSIIFETCFDVFQNIFSNDFLNKYREDMIGIEILENKDKLNNKEPKEDEKIYDKYSSLVSDLKILNEIGKDQEKIEELKKKLNGLKKDTKLFGIKVIDENKAEIEFFNELIQEIEKNIKTLDSSDEKKKSEIINDINENKKNDVINIPLYQRTFLYLDEVIKEKRNELIEFKIYSLPLTKVGGDTGNDIKRHICGFLNSQGGRLYIGINSQNIVKGVVLNSKDRDTTRNNLVNLTYDFYPNCRINKVTVDFIPIKYMNGDFVPKRYVVKVRVFPGDPDALYSMTNVGYHSIIRKNTQLVELNSLEIYNEIIARDELKKVKNQDNAYINEANIKDPEPEQNPNEDEEEEFDDLPFFGKNSSENLKLSDNAKNNIKEKGIKHKKKNKSNMVRDGTIIVKITNIDENIPINDVNRFFNDCKRSSQKILKGYGYLNFSNMNDAINCIARFNGKRLGNKNIKLTIQNNNN